MTNPQKDKEEGQSIQSVRREIETLGSSDRPPEIVRDQEVRDAGVVENPAPPEFAPPVEISLSQIPAKPQPQAAILPSVPVVKPLGEVIENHVEVIPTFQDAVGVLKEEGILTMPDGKIGVATVVVHQDRRSKFEKEPKILPKAA